AGDRRTCGHRRYQRFGEVPRAEEVDRDDAKRITDARRHTRDIEQGVDLAADHCGGPVDRRLVGQVDLVELLELQCRAPQVQADDLGAQLGELPGEMLTDARRAAGDDDTPPLVAPEVVDLSHPLLLIRWRHSVLLTSAVGFLLSQPCPDLSFAAAASMPAFISSI